MYYLTNNFSYFRLFSWYIYIANTISHWYYFDYLQNIYVYILNTYMFNFSVLQNIWYILIVLVPRKINNAQKYLNSKVLVVSFYVYNFVIANLIYLSHFEGTACCKGQMLPMQYQLVLSMISSQNTESVSYVYGTGSLHSCLHFSLESDIRSRDI